MLLEKEIQALQSKHHFKWTLAFPILGAFNSMSNRWQTPCFGWKKAWGPGFLKRSWSSNPFGRNAHRIDLRGVGFSAHRSNFAQGPGTKQVVADNRRRRDVSTNKVFISKACPMYPCIICLYRYNIYIMYVYTYMYSRNMRVNFGSSAKGSPHFEYFQWCYYDKNWSSSKGSRNRWYFGLVLTISFPNLATKVPVLVGHGMYCQH